ncbi:MAG TPA: metallophosphoesterase [Oscillospiraceae bacterium]|nr:metallophosphoesterase [Oscillospiraceae bacterium]
MEKVLSIILSVIMASSVLCVGVCAEEKNDLSFAVASDLHYSAPEEELEKTNDDPIFWHATRRCEMENETGLIIDEFLNQCAESDDVEYVLISGDLANRGRSRPEDHLVIAQKLRDFEKKSGKEVYVINGNHDASNDQATTLARFKEIYAEFGYDHALTTRADDCSYTADLGEKYRLIALDSNHETKSTEDGMTADRLKWVKEQAELAKEDGRYPIVMMHHNLLDHLPIQRVLSRNFIVKFHFTTAELLADWGIKTVFTGHEHCSDATVYTSALGNKLYDFATTSLAMYPLEYRVVKYNDNEIKYETRSVDKIDYDALTATTKGYMDEQIAAMRADLRAFSKGYLKAGVQYRLELSLSPEKMGIDEGSAYSKPIIYAVDKLISLLRMPLCGENSLQSIAKEYGIEIPDSDYKTGWDLATDLVAWHYSGGEHFDTDSVEVTTLLRAVATILRNDFAGIADDVLLKAANSFLGELGYGPIADSLTKYCISKFGVYTKAEIFLVAVASPILYKFACDNDGVDDNNGVIEGCGTVNFKTNVSNIVENLDSLSEKITFYLRLVMSYLAKLNVIFLK